MRSSCLLSSESEFNLHRHELKCLDKNINCVDTSRTGDEDVRSNYGSELSGREGGASDIACQGDRSLKPAAEAPIITQHDGDRVSVSF